MAIGTYYGFRVNEGMARLVALNRATLFAPADFKVRPEDLLVAIRGFAEDAEHQPAYARAEEARYVLNLRDIRPTKLPVLHVSKGATEEVTEMLEKIFGVDEEGNVAVELLEEEDTFFDEEDEDDYDENETIEDYYDVYGTVLIPKDCEDSDEAMVDAIIRRLEDRNLNPYADLPGYNCDTTLDMLIDALERYLDAHDRLEAFAEEYAYWTEDAESRTASIVEEINSWLADDEESC